MNTPIVAGLNIQPADWNQLRLRAIFDYCKWDAQCGDHAVLARFPLFLRAATVAELARLAETMTHEALAAEAEILERPHLLRTIAIPKAIREEMGIRRAESPLGHVRVMRFDFHYTDEGWRISEVNADVPGGYFFPANIREWNSIVSPKCERK